MRGSQSGLSATCAHTQTYWRTCLHFFRLGPVIVLGETVLITLYKSLVMFIQMSFISFTRSAFLAAHIPLFLYPFLHTVSKTRPFEYLRLTSLGVIGKLGSCVFISGMMVLCINLVSALIKLSFCVGGRCPRQDRRTRSD